ALDPPLAALARTREAFSNSPLINYLIAERASIRALIHGFELYSCFGPPTRKLVAVIIKVCRSEFGKEAKLGGQSRKITQKVSAVLGSLRGEEPFAGPKTTNHGESRITNCVKYDLGSAWRLVTVQDKLT